MCASTCSAELRVGLGDDGASAFVRGGRLASLCGLFREIFDFRIIQIYTMEKKEISVVEINPQSFKNLIYEFRDQLVMLDSDLAAIYGYSTKDLNRQVKNNREKFAEDFMFQLTKEDVDVLLMCNNSTSSSGYGGRFSRG